MDELVKQSLSDVIESLRKVKDRDKLKIYEHVGDGYAKAIAYQLLSTKDLRPGLMNMIANCLVSNVIFKEAMKAEGFTDCGNAYSGAFAPKKRLACVFEAALGYGFMHKTCHPDKIFQQMIFDKVHEHFDALFSDIYLTDTTHVYVQNNLKYIIENSKINDGYKKQKERLPRPSSEPLNCIGYKWPKKDEIKKIWLGAGWPDGINQ